MTLESSCNIYWAQSDAHGGSVFLFWTKMLGPLVDCFVDASSSDDARQKSLDSIIGFQDCSIGEVVGKLETALVNPSGAIRARGVLLLAKVLDAWPLNRLSGDELGFLLVFFRDRSRDSPCVPEVVAGLTAMLSRWSDKLDSSEVEKMLVTLFAEVFVQGSRFCVDLGYL